MKLSAKAALRYIEARAGTRIPKTTFYRMLEDGRIEAQRIGAKWLIPIEACTAFLQRCARGERY